MLVCQHNGIPLIHKGLLLVIPVLSKHNHNFQEYVLLPSLRLYLMQKCNYFEVLFCYMENYCLKPKRVFNSKVIAIVPLFTVLHNLFLFALTKRNKMRIRKHIR